MPSIDTVKRIIADDFKSEDREVAERIGNIYNYFAEQVTNVLNGNVDYQNLNQSVVTLNVSTDTNGSPLRTTQFQASIGLIGTSVINARNLTNRVNYLNSQPFISWSANGRGVYTINNITGLRPGEEYELTLELKF
jgi:hypothetical protein